MVLEEFFEIIYVGYLPFEAYALSNKAYDPELVNYPVPGEVDLPPKILYTKITPFICNFITMFILSIVLV